MEILIKALYGLIYLIWWLPITEKLYRLTSTMTASPNPKPQAGMSSAPKVENK